jgi:hypothetical protein
MASQAEWSDHNHRELVAALGEVRASLLHYTAHKEGQPPPEEQGTHPAAPPALNLLCSTFGLSGFERTILLLCAGMELDASFAGLCAGAQGDPARAYPTFSLALAAFAAPHWSALTPAAPLRRWRLIDIPNQPGPLVTSPLRIDERVLHFLTGLQYPDEQLLGMIEPVLTEELVPSHRDLAQRIAAAWSGQSRSADGRLVLVQLTGADEGAKRAIAAAGVEEAGLRLYAVSADHVPTSPAGLEGFVRLWEREASLTSGALYLEADALDRGDSRAAAQVSRLLERLHSPLLLGSRDPWRPLRRTVLTIEVRKPTSQEQRLMWQGLLGGQAESLNGHVTTLVSQFDLSARSIRASVQDAVASGAEGDALAHGLWDAGRAQARPRLDDLAQRIEAVSCWDDLVLPDAEKTLLREIAAQVMHRATVYEAWGFGTSRRGLGVSALFAGSSGTGKTLAAEVLANTLHLDLYRIDLASVVSKYIGETEKNLRRVFDAAEDGGAILFFDEADALFGKRSEVKDSHDRYANIEVNYLLQRMESYRGLAVLASNMKSALDPAFLRRIRFVVNFPFPDVAQRVEIWSRVFPPGTPTEGLDANKLARLNVTGGNIRNIALNAAFLAAEADEPVRMKHLERAARNEYAKIEKPVMQAEIGGWL